MDKKKSRSISGVSSFDSLRISLASPADILSWSYGEVKKPETINYRTHKPEIDGLFCPKIFGPVKENECLCGKYKRIKYKGVVCERCEVEVASCRVRRSRMGHITLATPIVHVWYLKILPSKIPAILDMTWKEVEAVLSFEKFVIIEPGLTSIPKGTIMSPHEMKELESVHGKNTFTGGTGGEAIYLLLKGIDLQSKSKSLRQQIQDCTSEAKIKKLSSTLSLVESFIRSGNKPEWMMITHLPVLPPDLRPLVALDGGRFATSDLNDLYRRILMSNSRLKKLFHSPILPPPIILHNEARVLQGAVDVLLDNGRRGRVSSTSSRRPLKSLSSMLKGKGGRFRQNLLGKRVDYSGRSVIVVGPELKLHQCGIPKKMAIELFRPFIYAKLESKGLSATIKQSRKIVNKAPKEVWDILDELMISRPVILNRAPTLHRLGIQAFEGKLVDGGAIRLHPLVCVAFNADFDGDQMAVHLPLSLEARLESRILMMSTNNILSPANGLPVIVPSQDMVLGLYYLSLVKEGEKGEGKLYSSLVEMEYDHACGNLSIHAKVLCLYPFVKEDGTSFDKLIEITLGRARILDVIPKMPEIDESIVDRIFNKKNISDLIDTVHNYGSVQQTVQLCDSLKDLGFVYATESGISFSKDDMKVSSFKEQHISRAYAKVDEYNKQYDEGLIPETEHSSRVIHVWSSCTDDIAFDMMEEFKHNHEKSFEDMNSLHMMTDSGARGSKAQMSQLVGMRGLMVTPSGEIIKTPIVSNFKEGLSVLEFFNSTHGARKGLSDTALKTANSGYLTRRLVDVAQDCIIAEKDCGTSKGLLAESFIYSSGMVIEVKERIMGRFTAKDILDDAQSVIVPAGTMIDESIWKVLEKKNVTSISIRSPLFCTSSKGICSLCYGKDLARGSLVKRGEAVGILAAQSIGEPGTQLTMRTFHAGGAAAQVSEDSFIDSPCDNALIEVIGKVIRKENYSIVASYKAYVSVRNSKSDTLVLQRKVPHGCHLYVENGDVVTLGSRIADWDPHSTPIISDNRGYIKLCNFLEGITNKSDIDLSTGITYRIVLDSLTSDLIPLILIQEEKDSPEDKYLSRYVLSAGSVVTFNCGDFVEEGDVIARISRESIKLKDITGGLPRVANIFEVRRPNNPACISQSSGYISIGKEGLYKDKIKISVSSDEGITSYLVHKGSHVIVSDGSYIEKGDIIVDGDVDLRDILSSLGVAALANHMIREIQSVYRFQGVIINDKHIEVILRQMLQKVEVVDPGDSSLVTGSVIDKVDCDMVNQNLRKENNAEVQFRPFLLGITKASLKTRSFLAAASFQETTRVLAEAAILGQIDFLEGLKENVVVGRLIPAGTGASVRRIKTQGGMLGVSSKNKKVHFVN